MKNDLALDLKVTRRKAGLTQADCAHLLSVERARISQMESGKRLPTLAEACRLSLIYDRPLDSLLVSVKLPAARELGGRLSSLPTPRTRWISTFNRQQTLSSLAERLLRNEYRDHDML